MLGLHARIPRTRLVALYHKETRVLRNPCLELACGIFLRYQVVRNGLSSTACSGELRALSSSFVAVDSNVTYIYYWYATKI